jgi:hypothetical protein
VTDNAGVVLQYGVHQYVADVVGKTVAQVKQAYAQIMNLPANAIAHVGGKPVPDSHVIERGQELEFIKEAGVKGAAAA